MKPEPNIFTGPIGVGATPEVIFTACASCAGTEKLEGSSAGVKSLSMCTGLIVPSLNTEMLLLPEFTARTKLWMASTARAPRKETVVGVGEVQLAAQTELFRIAGDQLLQQRLGLRKVTLAGIGLHLGERNPHVVPLVSVRQRVEHFQRAVGISVGNLLGSQ